MANLRIVFLLLILAFGAANSVAWAATQVGATIDNFTLQDYLGASHSLEDLREHKAIVVVFLGTECPLAKLYGPRLNELAAEYGPKSVAFVGVDSNEQDSLLEIGHYARVHKIDFPLLKDVAAKVADQFGATRTPEAFVLDPKGKVLYHGRIDDQFGVGYQRQREVKRELATALDEIVAGKPVSTSFTEPAGCYIGRKSEKPASGEITYTKHIAGMVDKHCVRCHRDGQIAPFTLTSYDDVSSWSETICEVIDDGRMPPWHANPKYGHFSNDAQMPAEEKRLFREWVKNGMPEGDPADLPEPTKYAEGWQIPTPDMIVKMPKPYTVQAKGTVPYQYFEVDTTFDKDVWIRGAEVRPGNRSVVHHIFLFYIPPGQEKVKGEDPLMNAVATFAPGMPAELYPDGYARLVPAGSRLVFQVHYTPSGTEQTDQSEVGLVFADPDGEYKEIKLKVVINEEFRIPPGEPNYPVHASQEFKRDTTLHALMPHMHYRGKAYRFTARYPDGKEEILLDVPRYDFNWQNLYSLAEPKLLPKGTVVEAEAHFDNSEDNLANPDPTQEVRWGEQTWEEMMLGSMVISKP